METILLVDDDTGVLDGQESLLRLNGYSSVVRATSAGAAREAAGSGAIALAILDLTLGDGSGIDVLKWMKTNSPRTVILVVTAASDLRLAVECMRAGAYDFLVKGTDTGRLPAAVRNALDHRNVLAENARLRDALVRPALQHPEAFGSFVTASEHMLRLFHYLEALAPLPDPILITGETGVGKEVIARAVHDASALTGPFVPVNLGGLDDHMFSDTLFGHTKGAYTGAEGAREGLLRTAAGGTLFLDEFGELSHDSQKKLLRLLDSGEYMPLGSDRVATTRARLILATNRDLATEVQQGRFRQDLYYRIAAHEVRIPPLRERPEDIAPIMRYLLSHHSERLGKSVPELDEGLIDRLALRSLSGNVRELEQLVLGALVQGYWSGVREGEPLAATPPQEDEGCPEPSAELDLDAPVRFGRTLPSPTEVIEELLREADRRYPGNRSEAAQAIGLSPQAFANRWRRIAATED
ncbi:MAG: sigma-54-dependent transcriptional regulator [Spirochaetaceae bacterium]